MLEARDFHTYHYVALGDSLTVGLGSDLFSPGFVELYAEDASKSLHREVLINKFARSGATSGELLEALYVPMICEAIQSSDIITITAGGNDLIDAAETFLVDQNERRLFEAMNTAINNIKKMINHIHLLHDPGHHQYILRIQNLYNPYPNITQADSWIQNFNAHLAEYTRFPHIKIADIYSAFKGREKELLHPNGVHPNNKGYAVMAEVLHHLGYGALAKR